MRIVNEDYNVDYEQADKECEQVNKQTSEQVNKECE